MYDHQIRLALFLHLLHERTQVFITFQHYHVTQRLSGRTRVGSKTKSIRPRLRPRLKLQDQDQDRGRSETSLVIRPRYQTPRLGHTSYTQILSSFVIVLCVMCLLLFLTQNSGHWNWNFCQLLIDVAKNLCWRAETGEGVLWLGRGSEPYWSRELWALWWQNYQWAATETDRP